MSDVKIEMNKAGLHELFTSPAVASLIEQATAQVKASAGDGFESETGIMGSRYRGIVYPATKGARD